MNMAEQKLIVYANLSQKHELKDLIWPLLAAGCCELKSSEYILIG